LPLPPLWLGDTAKLYLNHTTTFQVPFIVGQTKDEGAFFYRLTMNAFNNGQYDDNFIERKLPHILPVVSRIKTKLFPLTKLVE
jgi:hypothetical protein